MKDIILTDIINERNYGRHIMIYNIPRQSFGEKNKAQNNENIQNAHEEKEKKKKKKGKKKEKKKS